MAYVTKRGAAWAARWKDATGHWREERLAHANKTEARHYALDQEKKAERQRKGLDPLDGTGDETFADLFGWWWTEYGQRRRSQTIEQFARKNLLSPLGKLRVRKVTAAKLERVLNAKADHHAPRSRLLEAVADDLRRVGVRRHLEAREAKSTPDVERP